MRLTVAVALVAAVFVVPAASSSELVAVSFLGDGILVHEGTGQTQVVDVRFEGALERTHAPFPNAAFVGQGALVVDAETGEIEAPVAISISALVQDVAGRHVESWTVSFAGEGDVVSSGTATLSGADDFLRGAGTSEVRVFSGPQHGRYDLAFAGLAEAFR